MSLNCDQEMLANFVLSIPICAETTQCTSEACIKL